MKIKKLILMFVFLLAISLTIADVGDNNFQITRVYTPDTNAYQGQQFTVNVDIYNPSSTAGTMRLECGIYKTSTLSSWGVFSIFGGYASQTNNCITTETNVQTRDVTVEPGRTFGVALYPIAPKTTSSDSYALWCATYERCYKDAPGNTGLSSYKVVPIDLIGNSNTATCSDGILNQDEVDTDCGGSTCTQLGKLCYNGYQCNANSDCKSGYCTGGLCKDKPVTPPSPPIPTPLPPEPPLQGFDYTWWLVGLIAVVLLIFTGFGRKLLSLVGVRLK